MDSGQSISNWRFFYIESYSSFYSIIIYQNFVTLANYPHLRKPLCRVASLISFFSRVDYIPKLLWTLIHHPTNYSLRFLRDRCSLSEQNISYSRKLQVLLSMISDFYLARHLYLYEYFPSTVRWCFYREPPKFSVENNNAVNNYFKHLFLCKDTLYL